MGRMSLPAPRLALAVALVSVLVLWPAAAVAECDCHGNGVPRFNGTHTCSCDCVTNRTVSASGAVLVATFMPPDCRYTSAQVERMLVVVQRQLEDFAFRRIENAMRAHIVADNRTAEFRVVGIANKSATQLSVVFEIRDNGPDRSGLLAATFARQLLVQAVAENAAWVTAAGVVSATKEYFPESPVNSDPAIAAKFGNIYLPWETILFGGALIVIPFTVIVSDMIASDNFVTNEEEGRELLKLYASQRYAAPTEMAVSPVEQKRAMHSSGPKPAWLDGTEDQETDEGGQPPLRRRGTRSLTDFSAKFYANAPQLHAVTSTDTDDVY